MTLTTLLLVPFLASTPAAAAPRAAAALRAESEPLAKRMAAIALREGLNKLLVLPFRNAGDAGHVGKRTVESMIQGLRWYRELRVFDASEKRLPRGLGRDEDLIDYTRSGLQKRGMSVDGILAGEYRVKPNGKIELRLKLYDAKTGTPLKTEREILIPEADPSEDWAWDAHFEGAFFGD